MQLRPVAGIRRTDSLEIDETVYAIGNPQRLERTLSDGLISGKRAFGEVLMLQTTAPISPGSSGCGLFDSRGDLVDIATSGLKSAQCINCAIPAEDFWKQLLPCSRIPRDSSKFRCSSHLPIHIEKFAKSS